MAAQYRGPHKLILNRNERNLGICGHINRCVELSAGEYFVMAGGDDVSLPERCHFLVNKWTNECRHIKALMTNGFLMDEHGNNSGIISGAMNTPITYGVDCLLNGTDFVTFGCSMAYSRELFKVFGPLGEKGILEDRRLAFRGILDGGFQYFPEKLVHYRRYDGNTYYSEPKPRQRKAMFKDMEGIYGEYLHCIRIAKERGMIDPSLGQQLEDKYCNALEQAHIVNMGPLIAALKMIGQYFKKSYAAGTFSLYEQRYLSRQSRTILRKVRQIARQAP